MQKDTYFISDVYILFEFSTENTLLLLKKKSVFLVAFPHLEITVETQDPLRVFYLGWVFFFFFACLFCFLKGEIKDTCLMSIK